MCFICLFVSKWKHIAKMSLFHHIPLGYSLISHTTPTFWTMLSLWLLYVICHLSWTDTKMQINIPAEHICFTALHTSLHTKASFWAERKKENPFCLLLYLSVFQGKSPIIIDTVHRSNIISWHFVLDAREQTLNNCLSKTQHEFSFAHTLLTTLQKQVNLA